MKQPMTPSQIAIEIKARLDSLSWEFVTRDTFPLFTENIQWNIRGYANLALRILEREGLVIAARYGKNTLIWQKTTPRPLPEWI